MGNCQSEINELNRVQDLLKDSQGNFKSEIDELNRVRDQLQDSKEELGKTQEKLKALQSEVGNDFGCRDFLSEDKIKKLTDIEKIGMIQMLRPCATLGKLPEGVHRAWRVALNEHANYEDSCVHAKTIGDIRPSSMSGPVLNMMHCDIECRNDDDGSCVSSCLKSISEKEPTCDAWTQALQRETVLSRYLGVR